MDGIGAEHQEALALALAEMESLDAEIQREKIAVLVQTKKLEEQQQKHEAVQETQAEALKHIAQKIESMAKDMNELNLAEINISQNVERMRKSTGQAAAYALEDQLSKDICWLHLQRAMARVGLSMLKSKGAFRRMYLGQYKEVRQRFKGYVEVVPRQIREWILDEPTGRDFWTKFKRLTGLTGGLYPDYQIEHVVNRESCQGANHYLNYMVLHAKLNNSAEFKYGPGEVKFAAVGQKQWRFITKFHRWQLKVSFLNEYLAATHPPKPLDHFLHECDLPDKQQVKALAITTPFDTFRGDSD